MSDPQSAVATTPLNAMHIAAGAKMVPFAGYSMPVQYPAGIKTEHLHCRAAAGLFDVSHMGQVLVSGPQAAAELETLLPSNLIDMTIGDQSYSVLLTDTGTLRDDLMISRLSDESFYLVVNAGCKHDDIAYLRANLPTSTLEYRDQHALLALQGPRAAEVFGKLLPVAAELIFMQGCPAVLDGVELYVTRSGYTGEDGFEISVPAAKAQWLSELLLASELVEWVGLGARDSLRLEAGLCLYGHDMDTTKTPIEAAINFAINKVRREGGERAGGFPGSDTILAQLRDGAGHKRVGLAVEGRAPVREGAELVDEQGNLLGLVSSGGFSPCLEKPIAMGYLPAAFAVQGASLYARVRGKLLPVTVCKTPFVPQRYYRG